MRTLGTKFVDRIGLPAIDSAVNLFDVLNVLLLLAVFLSLGSRLVLPPGIGISLPTTGSMDVRETVAVLTAQSEKLLIFNGDICSMDTIGKAMEKQRRGDGKLAILIRPDRSLPVGTLLKICEIVEKAGYDSVQIAADRADGMGPSDGLSARAED
jgi:biopolymer transport protein ExbD